MSIDHQNPPAPESLAEAVRYFADKDRALDFMVSVRWPAGVECPHCGAKEPSFLKSRRIFKCKNRMCRRQFSVKVGTIFEDSALGLDKWLPALWMLANCRNGISSYELARTLGVTQKTAWFMLGRIRLAMQTRSFEKAGGVLEIDEAYVGGKAENMHTERRRATLGYRKAGFKGKTGVIAGVRRGENGQLSQVRAYVMKEPGARPHDKVARDMMLPGSKVYTDSATLHTSALEGYVREMVNHTEKEYVRGGVHTNSVENFWSVFKRAIKGTYVAIDPFHLFRYVDEQVFRYNIRDLADLDRFRMVLRQIADRRLTYRDLTGADLDPATT